MDKFMNMDLVKKLAVVTAGAFLLLHCFMFFVFRNYGVTPMMYLNAASVLLYGGLILAAKREMMRLYVVAVYLEFVLHMTMAVICTGWDSGFQITLIGISILLFYSEYLGRYLKIPYVPAVPICLLAPAAYLFSYVWIQNHPPKYLLPAGTSFFFQIFLALTVFSITLFVLYVFVELSVSSEQYLEKQAGHDQLTGLPNRHFFADSLSNMDFMQAGQTEENAGQEAEKKQQNGQSPAKAGARKDKYGGYWVAMLDIDDFKKINDTYGHNCGDYVLKEIAQILLTWRKDCRVHSEFRFSNNGGESYDPAKIEMTIGRWGGEEFLVLGRGGEEIKALLDDLRGRIMKYDFAYKSDEHFGYKHIRVTVTIGLAEFKPGMSARDWIGVADERLYKGKQNGKNQVVA